MCAKCISSPVAAAVGNSNRSRKAKEKKKREKRKKERAESSPDVTHVATLYHRFVWQRRSFLTFIYLLINRVPSIGLGFRLARTRPPRGSLTAIGLSRAPGTLLSQFFISINHCSERFQQKKKSWRGRRKGGQRGGGGGHDNNKLKKKEKKPGTGSTLETSFAPPRQSD